MLWRKIESFLKKGNKAKKESKAENKKQKEIRRIVNLIISEEAIIGKKIIKTQIDGTTCYLYDVKHCKEKYKIAIAQYNKHRVYLLELREGKAIKLLCYNIYENAKEDVFDGDRDEELGYIETKFGSFFPIYSESHFKF